MANLDLSTYVKSQYGSGGNWTAATTYGSVNTDNNSFYVGGSDSHYRARLYFTIPSDADIAQSEKLVLCLKGFGQNGGTLWTQRTRGYLSTTNLSTSDYGQWDTLASPVLSYLYKDAAGTSRITGSYSSSSGNDTYLIFSTTGLKAGVTYYIYLLPYGSDTAAMDSATWTNTWMDWENRSGRLTLQLTYKTHVTITYKVNGGSGTVSSTTLTQGVAGNVTSSTPTPPNNKVENAFTITYSTDGYTNAAVTKTSDTNERTSVYAFDCWTVNADGSGDSYSSNAPITISSNLTLFAKYKVSSTSLSEITTATATKDTDTSTRTVTLQYNNNTTANTQHTVQSTTSYTFDGWYDTSSGGTKLAAGGAKFKPTANDTFYAHFNSSTVDYGTITLPAPVRTGYTFSGWYTDAGTLVSTGGSWKPTGTLTLQARWTPEKRTITIIDNIAGQTLYAGQVDYDSQFTIPSFGTKQGVIEVSNLSNVELYYYDEYSGFEYTDYAPLKAHVLHTGDIYDITNDDFTYSGASFTVRSDVVLELVYTEEEDTPMFITPTTLSKPATRYGYTFIGWQPDYSPIGEFYEPNDLMTLYDDSLTHFNDYYIIMTGVWEKAVSADANVLYFKTNGTMKKAKGTYVKVNGSYKPALAIFIKKDGRWRTKAPS